MTRSARARLWLTWALRDARSRWAQITSIGLLLALGVGMYSAMSSMSTWRTASADASFAALRMHDLRVALTPGSYVPESRLSRALAAIPDRSLVTGAQERLVIPTQLDASNGRQSIIVPGRIVGGSVNPPVDALATMQGRALTAADDGRPIAQLERNFAKHYGLAAAGTVQLAGGRKVAYVGQALGPEYFVVTAPGADFGAEAGFAVVFTSLRTAQSLSGERGRVNELVLRVRRGASLIAIQAELDRSLRHVVPGTGFTFTAGSQEAAHRLLYQDAEGDQQMMNIFAALLLGAAAFAAFNLVSRTVEAQRREIGIGMALGARPRVLALRPLLLGGQVAVLGIALGIPAGFAANAWLRSVMQTFFPLPVLRTPMQLGVFAQGAALGLAVSLLATAIPLRRALAVTPVEAIRVGARAARSSGAAWITRGLRLPGGSLANMPLRNVLRAPRRTLMTVLGIGAVVAITLALAGVIDSFNATLDASRAEALAGPRQRLTVDLAAPQRADGAAIRAISASRVIGAEQQSLRIPATLSAGGRRLDAFLEVVVPDGPLWQPTLSAGTLVANRPGVVIAKRAAEDLHVGVGGRVTVRYPIPTGPSQLSADLHDASGDGNPHQSTAIPLLHEPSGRGRHGFGRAGQSRLGHPRHRTDCSGCETSVPCDARRHGSPGRRSDDRRRRSDDGAVHPRAVHHGRDRNDHVAADRLQLSRDQRRGTHPRARHHVRLRRQPRPRDPREHHRSADHRSARNNDRRRRRLRDPPLDPGCLNARDDARPRHTRLDLRAHVRPRRARRHHHGRARSPAHGQATAPHRHPIGTASRGITING